ncbi:MAG: pilus assembly protein PilM [Gammaproteobacteria bacterium]|nr:pilus assembly protein PilM [Gammaproteobacteria bacterium]
MHAIRDAILNGFARKSPVTPGFIGLDFSLERLQLMQLKKTELGNLGLLASAILDYPEDRESLLNSPHEARTMLQKAFKTGGFSGNRVVTCLPPSDVRLMSVSYRIENEKDNQTALLKLVEERLDGNIEDYVIDYLQLRGNLKESERLALVAVARREVVINYLELLRKCGLVVENLDIAPSAIKRLISSLSDNDESDNVLTINFGRNKSYIILMSGRRLLLDMEIDFGEHELLQQVSDELEIDIDTARKHVYEKGLNSCNIQCDSAYLNCAEFVTAIQEIMKPKLMKLVEEVNRSLIYVASETRGGEVRKIYLLGGIACWDGIDLMLSKLIDIPVSIPDYMTELTNEDYSAKHKYLLPVMSVVTGLALRGLTDHVRN